MNKKSADGTPGSKVFSRNKKAYYDYEVLETVEAGIELKGGEVKSIKSGLASIKEAFVSIDNGEMWLWSAHVPKWTHAQESNYNPTRKRKLLMHRTEIDSLIGKMKKKGVTLVPLKLYGMRGKVKVAVGLCRGRKKYEKREREKERQMNQELHKDKRKYMV